MKVTSTMIRAFCDGELAPEQERQVRQWLSEHPEHRLHVTFERELRERVAANIHQQTPPTPPELSERIQAALKADASPAVPEASQAAGGDHPEAATLGQRLTEWVNRPVRVNRYAVAACLLLVAVVIYVGMRWATIDEVAAPGRQQPMTAQGEMGLFAAQQHAQVANDPRRGDRLIHRTKAEAAFELSEALRVQSLVIGDLSPLDYEFAGAATTAGPGEVLTAQLVYKQRHRDEQGRLLSGTYPSDFVSLFLVPAAAFPTSCGTHGSANGLRWAMVETGQRLYRVLKASDGELAYILVACNDDRLDAIAASLGASISPIRH